MGKVEEIADYLAIQLSKYEPEITWESCLKMAKEINYIYSGRLFERINHQLKNRGGWNG